VSKQQPLDPPMVPFAVAGIIVFALTGLGVWVAGGSSAWLRICVAGFAWGFVGLAVMIRHDRRRGARQ
jgi:Protein of unknown function (DUF2530)